MQVVMVNLLKLPSLLVHVIKNEELDKYDLEVHNIMNDPMLPPEVDDVGNEVYCLNWWSTIKDKYPLLFKTVTAILSIFHGPRVECTFSIMVNVIDDKSGRINMETYSAIQTVKHSLTANQVSDYFSNFSSIQRWIVRSNFLITTF